MSSVSGGVEDLTRGASATCLHCGSMSATSSGRGGGESPRPTSAASLSRGRKRTSSVAPCAGEAAETEAAGVLDRPATADADVGAIVRCKPPPAVMGILADRPGSTSSTPSKCRGRCSLVMEDAPTFGHSHEREKDNPDEQMRMVDAEANELNLSYRSRS